MTTNTTRTVRQNGRFLARDLGIPYQSACRIADLHERTVAKTIASATGKTMYRRLEDYRPSRENRADRLMQPLLIDFLPELEDLETVNVPAIDELVRVLPGLRPRPVTIERARNLWPRVRVAALAATTLRHELDDLWWAHANVPTRSPENLARACLALCAALCELVRATEQFSDSVLLPYRVSVSSRPFDEATVFECWELFENRIDLMWHCSRGLEFQAAEMLAPDATRQIGPRSMFRLLPCHAFVKGPPKDWTAAARRAAFGGPPPELG